MSESKSRQTGASPAEPPSPEEAEERDTGFKHTSAGKPPAPRADESAAEQIALGRKLMRRYREAFRALAS